MFNINSSFSKFIDFFSFIYIFQTIEIFIFIFLLSMVLSYLSNLKKILICGIKYVLTSILNIRLKQFCFNNKLEIYILYSLI